MEPFVTVQLRLSLFSLTRPPHCTSVFKPQSLDAVSFSAVCQDFTSLTLPLFPCGQPFLSGLPKGESRQDCPTFCPPTTPTAIHVPSGVSRGAASDCFAWEICRMNTIYCLDGRLASGSDAGGDLTGLRSPVEDGGRLVSGRRVTRRLGLVPS